MAMLIRAAAVATVVLLAGPIAAGGTGSAIAGKPNFVVIMADDLGTGDVGCYGGVIATPNIDSLAAEGLRFTDFHSNGPNCSPTRCAFLTGRYQNRAGMPALCGPTNGVSPDEVTIAEVLKSAGYATALFGKWHVGLLPRFNPTLQGFEEYRGHLGGRLDYFTHKSPGGNELDWWNGLERLDDKGYTTTLIADYSVDFIRRKRSGPFFLYVAFNAPHTPIHDPETGRKSKTAEAYAKVVGAMDGAVGRIVEALKDAGVEDDTLVFFLSDNGAPNIPGASNGPLHGFKGTFWEGGHRVPGIARWPGRIPPGRTTDQTAMTMDLMPTCVELAGATLPPDLRLDGVSLASLLVGGTPLPPRPLFWGRRNMMAMREGPWKLLCEKKKASLFNLDEDLSEKNDLASAHPERLKRMLETTEAWFEQVSRGAADGASRDKRDGGQH